MTLTENQIAARESFLEGCPVVTIYGPTGVGKTHFVGSLLADERYQKVLFIDGDRGKSTIQAMTRHENLCIHRSYEGTNAFEFVGWMNAQIRNAHKVEPENVQAIVIEGLSRIYQELAAAAMAGASEDELMGPSLMRMYAPAAGMFKASAVGISNLQQQLRKAGRSVPVIITMNTKSKMVMEGKSSTIVDLPEVSDNCARLLMRGCEGFIALSRMGQNVSLATDMTAHNPFLKVRGMTAARTLARLRNPTCVTMLQAWADALAEESNQVNQALNPTESK